MSKLLDPADLEGPLLDDAVTVRQYDAVRGQHPMRAWEYAMAHHAIRTWRAQQDVPALLHLGDVGGAGSRFIESLHAYQPCLTWLIDPAGVRGHAMTQLLQVPVETLAHNPIHAGAFDVLTAISVIEHVPQVQTFARACHTLLRPGGLLFLTCDCWNCEGPDTAVNAHMRVRIYHPGRLQQLCRDLREFGFRTFGEASWGYPGNFVHDYSFASLAMVKR